MFVLLRRIYFRLFVPDLYDFIWFKISFVSMCLCAFGLYSYILFILSWTFFLSVIFMFQCAKFFEVFHCYVDVFKSSVSSSLFFVTGVLNIFMSPLLYVGIFMAYIFSVRLLKFLPVFSIFNVKWAIPLELFHIVNRLILQGSFTPELCFTRCSKDVSLTDWVNDSPKRSTIYWFGNEHSFHSVNIH